MRETMCSIKVKDCIHGGFVRLTDAPIKHDSDVSAASPVPASSTTSLVGKYSIMGLNVRLERRKSYSRVTFQSTLHENPLELTVDYVPPPLEWKVAPDDSGAVNAMYAHLNLKIVKISLSDAAEGILGSSIRVHEDETGSPMLKADDKDGQGLLEKPLESYGVDDLLQWPSLS